MNPNFLTGRAFPETLAGMKETSFEEAVGKKYPEWVAMIITVDANGRPNCMTAGWSMIASGVPPLLAVSVGHTRYTHELIRQAGEFVIAFPAAELEDAVLFCGSRSGRDIDKFAEYRLKALPAARVSVPLLGGCVANFECRLKSEMEAGDHTIFLGEVLASHVDDEAGPRILNFANQGFAPAVPLA